MFAKTLANIRISEYNSNWIYGEKYRKRKIKKCTILVIEDIQEVSISFWTG